MNFDAAKTRILNLVRAQGKAKNSEMLLALGGDHALLEQVREDLIFNDLAEDKKGVGLAYIGPRQDAVDEGLSDSARGQPHRDLRSEERAGLGDSHTAVDSLPEAVTPLKIFLSYGRDQHAEDAQRIKADLEARGHDVWFDDDRLKAGRDWEQYIEGGLRSCDKVVLLMTPHSVRRPDGYCGLLILCAGA